ncbi:MAG: hypothetical protein N2445_03310 [Acidobacteria bacterium]|nr:hypothetical protein [Acidobacteriota bacterium]
MKYFYFAAVFLLFLSCSDSNTSTKGRSLNYEDSLSDKRASSSRKAESSSKKIVQKFPELNIDFLFEKKQKEEAQSQNQRNIVLMEEDPAVVAERMRQEEEARKKAEEAAKKAEEERKKREEELKLNPPPPQPPPINFEFIGYMGPVGKRIGIFRVGGNDEELVLKRKGETIDKDFIIVDIGYESAEIGFEGFKETKTIPLVSGGK